MTWTAERVSQLRALFAEGLSCSQIAAHMGGLSRNAVIGKLHRMGISDGTRVITQRKPRVMQARGPDYERAGRIVTNAAAHVSPAIDLEPEIVPNPVSLLDLGEHHCRWPVSGGGAQTMFCGGDAVDKLSYCARHCRMAYSPDRRGRTPEEAAAIARKMAKARQAKVA